MSEDEKQPIRYDAIWTEAMLLNPVRIETGWEEWYTEDISKYRERVVYRRKNPIWQGYIITAMYAAIFATGFPWSVAPEWYFGGQTMLAAIGRSPVGIHWGWLGVAGAFALSLSGSIYARLRTKEDERMREDAYYPPKEYWEAVRNEQ